MNSRASDRNFAQPTKTTHELIVFHNGNVRKTTDALKTVGRYENALIAVRKLKVRRAQVNHPLDNSQRQLRCVDLQTERPGHRTRPSENVEDLRFEIRGRESVGVEKEQRVAYGRVCTDVKLSTPAGRGLEYARPVRRGDFSRVVATSSIDDDRLPNVGVAHCVERWTDAGFLVERGNNDGQSWGDFNVHRAAH